MIELSGTDGEILLSCAFDTAGGIVYDLQLIDDIWYAVPPEEESEVVDMLNDNYHMETVAEFYRKMLVKNKNYKLVRAGNDLGQIRWIIIE